MGVVGGIGLASTMSANVLDRTREFGVMHAIGARPKTVRRIVVAEGVFLALASCLVAVLPTLALTAVLGAGLGNLFMYAPLPFRISTPRRRHLDRPRHPRRHPRHRSRSNPRLPPHRPRSPRLPLTRPTTTRAGKGQVA